MLVKDQWVPFFNVSLTDRRFFISFQHGEGRWFEYRFTGPELGYHDPMSVYYRYFWLKTFKGVEPEAYKDNGSLIYPEMARIEFKWGDNLGQIFTQDVFLNFVKLKTGTIIKNFTCPTVSESGAPCGYNGKALYMDFMHKSHWRCYKCIDPDIQEALAIQELLYENDIGTQGEFVQIGNRELIDVSPEVISLTWSDVSEASERKKARKEKEKKRTRALKKAEKEEKIQAQRSSRERKEKARELLDLGPETLYASE